MSKRLAQSHSGGWYDPDKPKDKRNYEYNPTADGLVLIPAGNATRTRRAKAVPGAIEAVEYSRWGWKRVGYFVPHKAAEEIEQYLVKTSEKRRKQRERSRKRRKKQEAQYAASFQDTLKQLFPMMPDRVASAITEHTTEVGAGTVGRTGNLDLEEKARLATIAHVRHRFTNYDEFLQCGWDNQEAREMVKDKIDAILAEWTGID
jgi:hypothetical protein